PAPKDRSDRASALDPAAARKAAKVGGSAAEYSRIMRDNELDPRGGKPGEVVGSIPVVRGRPTSDDAKRSEPPPPPSKDSVPAPSKDAAPAKDPAKEAAKA